MGSSQSPPANYWYLCGLGKKLEGEKTFQKWLPQQDSGCTCWERLTMTFRHDVWTSRVLLKTMSCSCFPGFVLHGGAVSGCMNWALFWCCKDGSTSGELEAQVGIWPLGPGQSQACEDKTPRRVHRAPSTDMASVIVSLQLLFFPALKTTAVIGTWRLEDDSELSLPGEHSWRLLSLWERCGWGQREPGVWLWFDILPKHFAGGC